MPFQEKSAWIMSVALLLGGAFYVSVVSEMSSPQEGLAPPVIPVVAIYTVILVVVAVAGHIVAAVAGPKEANAPEDERDSKIRHMAGYFSRYLVGGGAILALGVYLLSYDGNLLFHAVFASLMISQISEYAIQIYLYRSAV